MTSRPALRVVVLISGGGSNLQALIDAQAGAPFEIVAVISNVADALGLERARDAGIEALTLNHRGFPDRAAFDAALAETIDRLAPGLVVLAGFMRILTPGFVARYRGRMMNIHPSLLPRHRGLHTHARALEAGDTEHGASVHFVTEELDGGPLIIQARVPVLPGDDPDTLAARVLAEEHRIYPAAVGLFAEGRLTLDTRGRVCLDGEPIRAPLGLTGQGAIHAP